MAIIGMRELTRNAKQILENVEENNEPHLITRHGRPVAAIVPVDPAEAERYIVAAAPEFLETRREAEEAGTDGRTLLPIRELAKRYHVDYPDEGGGSQFEPQAASPETAPTFGTIESTHFTRRDFRAPEVGVRQLVSPILGEALAEEVEKTAEVRIAEIASGVVQGAENGGLIENETPDDRQAFEQRVYETSKELFVRWFADVLANALIQQAGYLSAGTPPTTGFEYGSGAVSFADAAIEETSRYVGTFNRRILELGQEYPGEFSAGSYELVARMGLEAREFSTQFGYVQPGGIPTNLSALPKRSAWVTSDPASHKTDG
jgi:prevent-host-death family protein